jgi:hypothetical protein
MYLLDTDTIIYALKGHRTVKKTCSFLQIPRKHLVSLAMESSFLGSQITTSLGKPCQDPSHQRDISCYRSYSSYYGNIWRT